MGEDAVNPLLPASTEKSSGTRRGQLGEVLSRSGGRRTGLLGGGGIKMRV